MEKESVGASKQGTEGNKAKRYIDADLAKEELIKAFAFHAYGGEVCCSVIDRIPTADVVESKNGHRYYIGSAKPIICRCGLITDKPYNYCPQCGTQLRKKT